METVGISSTSVLQRYIAENAKKSFMIRDILHGRNEEQCPQPNSINRMTNLCGAYTRHLLRKATNIERMPNYMEKSELHSKQIIRPQARLPGEVMTKLDPQDNSHLILPDSFFLPPLAAGVGFSPQTFFHGSYGLGACPGKI